MRFKWRLIIHLITVSLLIIKFQHDEVHVLLFFGTNCILKQCQQNCLSKNVQLGISWRTAAVSVPILFLEEDVSKAVPVTSNCVTSYMGAQASIFFLEHFHKARKNLHVLGTSKKMTGANMIPMSPKSLRYPIAIGCRL